jgi:hypothetical protein
MKKLVEIVSLNDETDYISLDLNNDLNQLKLIIKKYFGIYEKEQIWFKNGTMISTEKIETNETDRIHILVHNQWLKIYIKNTNNQIIDLPMFRSKNTINDIKLLIFSKCKIRPDKFYLIYNNEILNDQEYLSKYNIQNLTTLNLVIKNQSGFN